MASGHREVGLPDGSQSDDGRGPLDCLGLALVSWERIYEMPAPMSAKWSSQALRFDELLGDGFHINIW